MTQFTKQSGKRAIVIGGSMAGLLAARVLSDTYDEVVVIERDSLPASATARKGVPQGLHAHALLARGLEILEALFPGLTRQLINQGAPQGWGRFYVGGGFFCRIENGPKALFVSRPCLESKVRARLLTLTNVYILENCNALGLVSTKDHSRVTGVRVIRRQTGIVEEILSANLVVDASGRGSRTPAWLESMGYARPEVELVDVKMGYASRFYQRQAEHLDGDLIANIAATSDNKRACGMLAQEGDRWIVTLAGYFGDYPPTDETGYLEFAKSLPVPDIYEVIRAAKPLSDPVPFKFPANQWRHYEKIGRFPEGFLVIGDGICSFTPVYGQGMTVAALEALALQACLRAGMDRLAQRFFKQASKIVNIAWSIAVGSDLSLSEAKGSLPAPIRFINWYMGKLQIAARHDPVVALTFMKVAHLMVVPSSVMYPRITWRVLAGNLWPKKEPEEIEDRITPAWQQS